MNYTDDNIAQELYDKKPEALQQLYKQYCRPLFHYSNAYIDDPVEAEDIVMQSFLKLMDLTAKFPNKKSIKAWLYLTCRNHALDLIRKQKVHTEHQERLLKENNQPDDVFILEIEEELALREAFFKKLKAYIDELPPQSSRILKLLFYEQKTLSETAAILDLSLQTVKNTRTTAVQKLKKVLNERELIYLMLLLANYPNS